MESESYFPAGVSRRDFIKVAAITGAAIGTGASAWAEDSSAQVPMRQLGRTGQKISAIGLGGFHIGKPQDEQEGIRLIRQAIDGGITFMDNCWDYHDGGSEVRMGKALKDGYRERVFLMSKIDGRTKQAAEKQIDESLKRLQTDRIDLMQFHEIIRLDDPDRIFAPGGGMEALIAAQKAGKVRWIGFTGHKDPLVHLRMLEIAAQSNFRFDAVQMPLNVLDAHFRSFEKKILPVLVKEQIGVLGMKPLGAGKMLESQKVTAMECLQYALNLPTSTVITGIQNQRDLDQALQAARTFKPMSAETVSALLKRTEDIAKNGIYERFKTTADFDGTAHNPQWLG